MGIDISNYTLHIEEYIFYKDKIYFANKKALFFLVRNSHEGGGWG